MEHPGGRGHQGCGAPGRPARARVAGAGLCLVLVVGAGAGPALAAPGTDPGGSATASVGDVPGLAGLPGAGSFDPLRPDRIALRPGDDFADRTVDHTIPFTLTNPKTGTTRSFKVRVVQPFSYNDERVWVDQLPQVGITIGRNWPWPGVKIWAGDQSEAAALKVPGGFQQTIFPRFSIDNRTSRPLRPESAGKSTTVPAWSTTPWLLDTTVYNNGSSSTNNGFGWYQKTKLDGSTSQGSSYLPDGTPDMP